MSVVAWRLAVFILFLSRPRVTQICRLFGHRGAHDGYVASSWWWPVLCCFWWLPCYVEPILINRKLAAIADLEMNAFWHRWVHWFCDGALCRPSLELADVNTPYIWVRSHLIEQGRIPRKALMVHGEDSEKIFDSQRAQEALFVGIVQFWCCVIQKWRYAQWSAIALL